MEHRTPRQKDETILRVFFRFLSVNEDQWTLAYNSSPCKRGIPVWPDDSNSESSSHPWQESWRWPDSMYMSTL